MDFFIDWGINQIQNWVIGFLLDFFSVFPDSPVSLVSGFEVIGEYLPMLNYFIPFNYCINLISTMCTAIASYYGVKLVKGTLTVKNNFLGNIINNIM